MSDNRRCQQHLTNKSILSYMTHLYKWLSSRHPTNDAELASRDRSIKNILHIFSRLLQYTAAHKDVIEQSVSSLFARLHERVSRDEAALNASARIVFQELTNTFDRIALNETAALNVTQQTHVDIGAPSTIHPQPDKTLKVKPKKTLLESYV